MYCTVKVLCVCVVWLCVVFYLKNLYVTFYKINSVLIGGKKKSVKPLSFNQGLRFCFKKDSYIEEGQYEGLLRTIWISNYVN